MKTKRLATQLGPRLMSALALAVLALPHAFADDQDLHASMHQEKGKTRSRESRSTRSSRSFATRRSASVMSRQRRRKAMRCSSAA